MDSTSFSAASNGVDILVGDGLGDRDDQPVLERLDARIQPAERHAAEHAALDQRVDGGPRLDRQAQA